MKKTLFYLLAALTAVACQNDDTDFSAYINGEGTDTGTETSAISTIYIAYNGTTATVTGDDRGYVTVKGADVTVNTGTDTDSLLLVLSGTATDGSLLVFRERRYGLRLNGVSLHNADGPAINNQCGKTLYLEVAAGTTNTLTDGTAYDETVAYQQKGALFSEGQVCLLGTGALSVTGRCKNAIACDDYMVIDDNVKLLVTATADNGIKVNDGIWINDGTISIGVSGDAARGIRCDSVVVITGGDIAINTSGDCVYDSEELDYSSAACIKCDYAFTMSGGTLNMKSTGDGGKGINCAQSVTVSGGTLIAVTTGGNDEGKPKAVKGDTGITVSGGSFYAQVEKSWACDNGTESETPADHLTIVGTPATATVEKKLVDIRY